MRGFTEMLQIFEISELSQEGGWFGTVHPVQVYSLIDAIEQHIFVQDPI